MRIETTKFGTIEVHDDSIIHVQDGMLGLERIKRFVLLEDQPESAYKWLQAVDDPGVAFVVVNPLDFFSDYEVILTDEQTESLAIGDDAEAVMFTTVTVDRESETATTNLLGPIVVNARTLQAQQIVLQDERNRYTTKHIIRSASEFDSVRQAAYARRGA
jgi:flagellar assembly factor FliW